MSRSLSTTDLEMKPVILCWNFPYTPDMNWGFTKSNIESTSQHNDGWAIQTLPKFFQRAYHIWSSLNHKNKWNTETNSVNNEVTVEVWLSLRLNHYKQWKMESGKLFRRPEAKLKGVKTAHKT